MTHPSPYLKERSAAQRYHDAFLARSRDALRRTPAGMIIDDPDEDERLARNLIEAAQCWKRALEVLGCPLPPRLEREAAGLL